VTKGVGAEKDKEYWEGMARVVGATNQSSILKQDNELIMWVAWFQVGDKGYRVWGQLFYCILLLAHCVGHLRAVIGRTMWNIPNERL
jgi:hypothetical protein